MRVIPLTIVEVLNYLSAAFALIAAFFWFRSAVVKPRPREAVPDEDGWCPSSIHIDGSELSDLLKEQSRRSALAAVFAGFAATTQAIAIALPYVSI